MKDTLGKIFRRLSSYMRDGATRAFISHNLKKNQKGQKSNAAGPEVLFELNAISVSHVAYSYLANVLADRHDARIKAYTVKPSPSLLRKLDWKLSQLFSAGEFGVYKSFGTSDFIQPNISKAQHTEAIEIAKKTLDGLKTKKDIEDIEVDGVWLGDLIYDSFLMDFRKPTIDSADPVFRKFLTEAIELYIFWRDYFDTHDVKAVNVSHCVYLTATALRIAVSRGISAYQVNATHAYCLNDDNCFAYADFGEYHEHFMALPADTQDEGLKEARKRIDLRFAGQVGVDMGYSTKSAYSEFKEHQLLKESSKIKILIATHCFFDSPHSFGNNLFPDFYEWLEFLGAVSESTDHDWYIKTHPDFLPGTMEVIKQFAARYPKFTLLPADSSHHQIIAEGIDFALTCYGTIGFEYAALGVPVINASLVNPHIAYGFNFHPRNIDEYAALLGSLESLTLDININDVYEYYFMHNIYNTQNWIFQDFHHMQQEIGGPDDALTPKVYCAWMDEWTQTRHDEIICGLNAYIESRDFRLSHRHFGQEFDLKEISTP